MLKKGSSTAMAAACMNAEHVAEEAFCRADSSGDGWIELDELSVLLYALLADEIETHTSQDTSPADIKWFMRKEFRAADQDSDGRVDWDEFVIYYNSLIERIDNGELSKALANAAAEAEKAAFEIQQRMQRELRERKLAKYHGPDGDLHAAILVQVTRVHLLRHACTPRACPHRATAGAERASPPRPSLHGQAVWRGILEREELWYEHVHEMQMDVHELEKALCGGGGGTGRPVPLSSTAVRETPPAVATTPAASATAGMPLQGEVAT